MLALAGEGDARHPAVESATGELGSIGGEGQGERDRPRRHLEAGRAQQLRREQGLGERHGDGETAGRTQDGEGVGDREAGPAVFLLDPGLGQAGFL